MLKTAATLFCCALLWMTAVAQEAVPSSSPHPLPAVQPAGRPVIGIALEGGGALGIAHIGVLQWLEEHRIPVDRVSGTSMGSLVGAFYASGRSPAEMRAIATSGSFTRVFTLQLPYVDSSFRRREDRHEIPHALTVGLRGQATVRNALLIDRGVTEFLTTELAAYNREPLDYDRFPIPFRCVATDLNTLRGVTFSSGPLPQAVRASISIPGVFSPVVGRDGHYLVDGGIVDNLPTGVLRSELHAERVIAVVLQDSDLSNADTASIVGVLNRAFSAGIAANVAASLLAADVVIDVPVGSFSGADYARAAELIDAGYKAAEKSRAVLLPMALDEAGWKTYLAARESRRRPPSGVLEQVKVEGARPGQLRQILNDFKPIEGQPITPAAAIQALKSIQSSGETSATWETFQTAGPDAGPDGGIRVRLTRDKYGPPYLLLSPEIGATTSNPSRGELATHLIYQNLGGYGSELRGKARIGYMTDLSAEYYRLLTAGGFFVQPGARLVREPVYIWANQKRIAERFQENIEASVRMGRTFSNKLQISGEWTGMDTRWGIRTGTGGGPYLTGTAQTGLLHIDLDLATAETISPKGFRFSAAAGAFYHATQSANAPLVRVAFGRSRNWKGKSIFGISGEVDSYLRAPVAEPYRFTLGGPMRLSASSFDEFRGTDVWLARTGYLHRIAALPTGLGQGLYMAAAYEAGEIWSPESRAILRQDGMVGLVGNTPLGLVTFGVSVGDAGHRKVFFTVGRWF